MEYKISAFNYLCIRPGPNGRWTALFQLTEEQQKELAEAMRLLQKEVDKNFV